VCRLLLLLVVLIRKELLQRVVIMPMGTVAILGEKERLGRFRYIRGDKCLLVEPVGNKVSLRSFVGQVAVAETVA
jgi:hypothetical protein